MKPLKLNINGFMGVNLQDNVTLIKDSELLLSKNLAYSAGRGLVKRSALAHFIKVFEGSDVDFSSIHIPVFECEASIVGVYDNTTVDVVAAITPTGLTSSVNIPKGYSGRPMFVAYNQEIYCFVGWPYTYNAIRIYKDLNSATGLTVAAFGVINGDNNWSAKVGCVYRDRLVYLNLGPGYENAAVFSDDLEPDVVGTSARDTRAFQFGGRDGDEIVAAVEVQLSDVGTPAQSALLVLRQLSAYLLQGEPAQTSDEQSYYGDAGISKINVNCGCASAQTVVTTPYGVLWAGFDDVWFMRTGQVPIAVGTKIRQRLLQTPPSARFLWSAIYKDGIYRLSIVAPGQGPASSFDACGEQWWLDLRAGAPQDWTQARWFGPQVYNILSLDGTTVSTGTHMQVIDTRPGRTNDIYSIEGENMVVYDVDSAYDVSQKQVVELIVPPASFTRVNNTHTVSLTHAHDLVVGDSIKIDNVSLPNVEAEFVAGTATVATVPSTESFTFTLAAPNPGTFASTLTHIIRKANTLIVGEQNNNAITTDLHSKVYDLGNPMIDKMLHSVDLNLQVSEPTKHVASVLIDRGRQVETINEETPVSAFETSVDALNDELFSEEFVSIGMFPSPTSRRNGKTIQLQLADTPGYIIDSSMTTFKWFRIALKTATLTAGYYANLKTFMDEVVRAMNAADTVTYTHNQSTSLPRELVASIGQTNPFTFLFVDDGSVVADQGLTSVQLLANRRVGAMIGLNTRADQASEGTTGDCRMSAIITVPFTRSPTLEYAGITLKLRPQRREPI